MNDNSAEAQGPPDAAPKRKEHPSSRDAAASTCAFTPEDWTDFLRGLAPAEKFELMRLHREICHECARASSVLENVVQLAITDRAYEPPAPLVAAAERIFAPVLPGIVERLGAGLRRLTAQLEWDSFGGALPEGVRSLRADSRHVVYRAGRYSIDLIVDTEAPPDLMTLTGQVADESAPGALSGAVQPLLLAGRDVIASATSTEFGEFSLQYRGGRPLSLWIPMERSGECIELPMPSSENPATEVNG